MVILFNHFDQCATNITEFLIHSQTFINIFNFFFSETNLLELIAQKAMILLTFFLSSFRIHPKKHFIFIYFHKSLYWRKCLPSLSLVFRERFVIKVQWYGRCHLFFMLITAFRAIEREQNIKIENAHLPMPGIEEKRQKFRQISRSFIHFHFSLFQWFYRFGDTKK